MRPRTIHPHTQQEIKQENLTAIVNFVMTHENATKRDIEKETGLSWSLVSRTVNRYLELGYFKTTGLSTRSGRGRTGLMLQISDDVPQWALGVSLSAREVKIQIASLREEAIRSEAFPVPLPTQESVLSVFYHALDFAFEMAKEAGKSFLGIGISAEGKVSVAQGALLSLTSLPPSEWNPIPLVDEVERSYGIPATIETNAVNVLFAEFKVHGTRDALLIHLGEGVSFSSIHDGFIPASSDEATLGECVFPTSAEGQERIDDCASIAGIERTTEKKIEEILSHPEAQGGLWEKMGRSLAFAIYNLTRAIQAPSLLFSGRLAQAADYFLPALKETYSSLLLSGGRPLPMGVASSALDAAMGGAIVGVERGLVEVGMKS